jgi:RNA polymerase sigma-70 factor (ECF subfamily)
MGRSSLTEKTKEPILNDLVQAAKDGDRKALSLVIERSQARLYRFCLYLTGDPRLSEDLCQDTFVKVLEKLKSLRKAGDFQGWLYRTAKNLYIDQWRRGKRHEPVPLDSVEERRGPPAEGMPDLVLEIRAAMASLDLEDQVLLLLIDQQGHSYKEAAGVLGISEAAVTSRIYRVRRAFLEAYEKD